MGSRIAFLVLLVACSKPTPVTHAPPPAAVAVDAGPIAIEVAAVDAAAVAVEPSAVDAAPPAADLAFAEPQAPVVECHFDAVVHCHSGLPCKRTWPAQEKGSLYPNTKGQLSPAATTKARATDPEACCYVEFVTRECD